MSGLSLSAQAASVLIPKDPSDHDPHNHRHLGHVAPARRPVPAIDRHPAPSPGASEIGWGVLRRRSCGACEKGYCGLCWHQAEPGRQSSSHRAAVLLGEPAAPPAVPDQPPPLPVPGPPRGKRRGRPHLDVMLPAAPALRPLRVPQPVPDNRHRTIRRRGSPGQAHVSAAGAPVVVVADEGRAYSRGRAPACPPSGGQVVTD